MDPKLNPKLKALIEPRVTEARDAMVASAKDPQVRPYWIDAFDSFLYSWDVLNGEQTLVPEACTTPVGELVEVYLHHRAALIHKLEAEYPIVLRVFGKWFCAWLPTIFFNWEGRAIPEELKLSERLMMYPFFDNRLISTGAHLWTDAERAKLEATQAEFAALNELIEALKPGARRGRRSGSGQITTAKVEQAIQSVAATKEPITQEAVAELIGVNPRTLQRFLKRNHLSWEELMSH